MNRERLTILRDHLSKLDPHRFDMSSFVGAGEEINVGDMKMSEIAHNCGTTCCVAGWSNALFRPEEHERGLNDDHAANDLGLTEVQKSALFFPSGWLGSDYKPSHAVAAIQSMLDNPNDDAPPVWPERKESQ